MVFYLTTKTTSTPFLSWPNVFWYFEETWKSNIYILQDLSTDLQKYHIYDKITWQMTQFCGINCEEGTKPQNCWFSDSKLQIIIPLIDFSLKSRNNDSILDLRLDDNVLEINTQLNGKNIHWLCQYYFQFINSISCWMAGIS